MRRRGKRHPPRGPACFFDALDRWLLNSALLALSGLFASQLLLARAAGMPPWGLPPPAVAIPASPFPPAPPGAVRPALAPSPGGAGLGPAAGWGQLHLLAVNRPQAPGAGLALNGEPLAGGAWPRIALHVRPGDRIDLIGPRAGPPLRIRAVYASPSIASPAAGEEWWVPPGTSLPLGRVEGFQAMPVVP